jgi:hypothetical protein
MKRLAGLILIALLVTMGCTFSSMIPTPTPPNDAPLPPPVEPTATRPQTAFIDSRDPNANVVDETINVQNAEAIADQSASGAQSGGAGVYNTTYTTSGAYNTNTTYQQPNYYQPQNCAAYNWTYVYTVRPGDTLTNIAARAGTTWQVLAQANCLPNANRILVGQVLRVPVPINPGPFPPPNPYPPNPNPPYPGVQSVGAVIPSPYISGYGGQYQLQAGATVTLVWAINPAGLTRVDFYYAGGVIGTDSYFGDGVAITWVVPTYTNGYLNALGYSYGNLSRQTAQNTLVYTNNPSPITPTPQPPVVVGSGLSISPFDSVNNNTFILPPGQLITFSWPATFPTATERVVFELIPPGGSTGQAMGVDTNLGDGTSIIWNAVLGTQGTVRAVAYFTGGYPPQYSDSYYIIAGNP